MDFTTNFCGPYWSDGTFQSSVCPNVTKPVNEWDKTCARHDCDLYNAQNLQDILEADTKFYLSNKGKGIKRSLAGYLVKNYAPAFRKMTAGAVSAPVAPIDTTHDPGVQPASYYVPPPQPAGTDKGAYGDWMRAEAAKALAEFNKLVGDRPKMNVMPTIGENAVYFDDPSVRYQLRYKKKRKSTRKKNRTVLPASRDKN